jgi:hypothetical protein
VKFVDSMNKLSGDYLATSYPAWLKENGLTDTAKSRSTYAALGTIVQQYSSLDKATVEKLFADNETSQPSTPSTLGDNIDALVVSLIHTKNTYTEVARDTQICITKLEDIRYRYLLVIKPFIEKYP